MLSVYFYGHVRQCLNIAQGREERKREREKQSTIQLSHLFWNNGIGKHQQKVAILGNVMRTLTAVRWVMLFCSVHQKSCLTLMKLTPLTDDDERIFPTLNSRVEWKSISLCPRVWAGELITSSFSSLFGTPLCLLLYPQTHTHTHPTHTHTHTHTHTQTNTHKLDGCEFLTGSRALESLRCCLL